MGDARLGVDFGKLFTANLSSSLADGIARTAVPLLAVQLTDDPLLIAGIAALQMVPWLLFAIPAGILVDGVDRRRALAVANSLRTLLAVALVALVATGALSIVTLYIVILLYGVGETVYDSAIRAVVPSLVPKSLLPRANGRIEAAETVVQNFLAGPVTSLLFAVTVLISLGINALAFALAAGLALALPAVASGRQFAAPAADARAADAGTADAGTADAGTTDAGASPPAQGREPWFRSLGHGFRFIFGNRMLTTLLFLTTFIGLMFSAATSTFILFLVDDQGLPEELFGLFMLTGAAGGILGSLLAGRLSARFGTGPTMAVANLVASAPVLVLWFAPNLWVAAAMNVVTSIGVLVWNVLIMSLRQSIVPGRLLGRVHGSWRTILWGSMPIGSLLGGLLARVDITLPFLVGGGLATVAGLVFFRFLTRLPNPEDVDNGDPPTAAPPAPVVSGESGAAAPGGPGSDPVGRAGVAEAGPTDPLTRD